MQPTKVTVRMYSTRRVSLYETGFTVQQSETKTLLPVRSQLFRLVLLFVFLLPSLEAEAEASSACVLAAAWDYLKDVTAE